MLLHHHAYFVVIYDFICAAYPRSLSVVIVNERIYILLAIFHGLLAIGMSSNKFIINNQFIFRFSSPIAMDVTATLWQRTTSEWTSQNERHDTFNLFCHSQNLSLNKTNAASILTSIQSIIIWILSVHAECIRSKNTPRALRRRHQNPLVHESERILFFCFAFISHERIYFFPFHRNASARIKVGIVLSTNNTSEWKLVRCYHSFINPIMMIIIKYTWYRRTAYIEIYTRLHPLPLNRAQTLRRLHNCIWIIARFSLAVCIVLWVVVAD